MAEKPVSLAKQGVLQIGAGGSAGFVEVCIMHPLDLVKTRMQLQSAVVTANMASIYYNGILDCFQKMYAHEGIYSFYKGIVPPILAETPKRAVKFFTFEQYKNLFLFGAAAPTPLTFSMAGAFAGITEAILVNPFEVVKVFMQSDRSKLKESPGTWSVTKKIVKANGLGLQGLNKGLSATVARNGIFNMVYFGFYHSVKNLLPDLKVAEPFLLTNAELLFSMTACGFVPYGLPRQVMREALNTLRPVLAEDNLEEFFKKLIIGFVSGTLASCLNIPFDVAKSRMQGPQPEPGRVKYKNLLPTLKFIYAEEGWRALYKGLVPKVMRLGPGGAIMLVVYDYAYQYLLETFPD